MVLKCLIYLSKKTDRVFRTVPVEEKRRIMQMPVKATWEYYCPSGKTVKTRGQSCNIYTPYKQGWQNAGIYE